MVVRNAAIAAASAVAALALPGAAHAAVIAVTTNADAVASDGACSLREAVQAANTDTPVSDCPAGSGADQITLGATTYTLAAGELGVTSELTITGAGAASTTIDGNHNGRVFQVMAGGKLTIDSALITGGQTTSGGTGSSSTGNDPGATATAGAGGSGGNGGGIASAGILTMLRSRVSANVTGDGGLGGNAQGAAGNATFGGGGFAFGGLGGGGGNGGGVYSTGTLTITGSTIDGNRTGNGGTGGSATGGTGTPGFASGGGTGSTGGQGGSGGGVYAAGSAPTITASTISGNTTGTGGQGGDGHGGNGNAGGGHAGEGKGGLSGKGGDGGGVWFQTSLSAFDDTFSGNTTGGGNFGGQGFGGDAAAGSATGDGTGGNGGTGGSGGGVFGSYPGSGNLDLERSLLTSNHTGGGGHGGTGWEGPGATAKGGNGGAAGGGGGLDNNLPLSFAINVTFTGNTTGSGGDRGTGPPLSPSTTHGNGGAGGNGGAALDHAGTLGLLGTTVTGNTQGAGGAGNTPGAAGAGSLRRDAGSFGLGNSIVDGTCSGTVGDAGGNLVTIGSTSCPGALGNPQLGPLQDNGGPTLTMAIGASGDAVDKVAPSSGRCVAATDQRGATRPSLVRCDIGAYELAPPIATSGDASGVGTTSAKLGGTLDPSGLRTRWYFEYGTSSSYGSVTPDQFATGGSADVVATLTGLSPNTTYHYRLVGVNPDGTRNGADRSFTTDSPRPPLPTPPKISGLKLKPKKFRVSGRKPHGTTVSYKDRLAAITTFTVLRPARGVRVKGHCRKPSKRHGKRCTRLLAVGHFTHVDHPGTNRFHWGGKAGGHKLRRGSYRLRAVPVAGVLAGKAVTVSFRVVK
jgi:CSLREA domain-containing protein